MKTLTINVTEQHIKDAKASIFHIVEEKEWCPIALAMYETIIKRPYQVRTRLVFGRRLKHILFFSKYLPKGGASNPIKVAETIRLESEALNTLFDTRHIRPSVDIKLPKKVEEFIVAFDKGQPVEPFTFNIDIKA